MTMLLSTQWARTGVPADPESNLERARSGDVEAFTALIQDCDASMRALVHAVVRDRWLMDDVLQQAYEKAFRHIATFRGDSSFKTWLHRICWTTAVDMLRAEGRRSWVPIEEQSEQLSRAADPAVHTVDRITWEQAWRMLPDEQRAALALVIGEGLDYAEAAVICGTVPGTIASRISRGKSRLRSLLTEARPPDRVVTPLRPVTRPGRRGRAAPTARPGQLPPYPVDPGDGPSPMESLA